MGKPIIGTYFTTLPNAQAYKRQMERTVSGKFVIIQDKQGACIVVSERQVK